MPLPTAAHISSAIKASLAANGAPGLTGPSPWTGVPFNALHRLADLASQVAANAVASHLSSGVFVGSVGGVSAAASAPAPLPLISPAHVALAAQLAMTGVPAQAAGDALSVAWAGTAGASIPLAVRTGILNALTSCGWGVTVAPGELAFAALLSGFLTWVRPPIEPSSLLAPLLSAWSADPDVGPGERSALATVYALGISSISALDFSCAVANPAGTGPVIPGTPYPSVLPPVIL